MPTAEPAMPTATPTGGSAAAVLDLLRRRLDRPDLAYAAPPERLTGGFWAEIIAFRLDGAPPELSGDLVVRIMPDEAVGRRETIVQRLVAEQGFPAPAVRLDGGPDDGLGRAYLVMDRVSGAPMLADLSPGSALLSAPKVIRQLPRRLAEISLQLHLLDPEPVIATLRAELPGTWIDTDDMFANLAAGVALVDDRLLSRAIDWLSANRREPDHRSLCHGDLHPFNVLVDGDDAVLVDWSNGVVADPAFDLAFTMTTIRHVPVDMPKAVRPVARRGAAWIAHRLLADYRELAGPHGIQISDDQLAWHNVCMATRMLAELEGWRWADQLGDHPNHPFLIMEDGLRDDLRSIMSRR